MNLGYASNYPGADLAARELGRSLVRDWRNGSGTPFYDLYKEKDVPAVKVKAEIDKILAGLTDTMEKERPRFEAFLAYVMREIKTEKTRATIARTAAMAREAGYTSRDALRLFEDELNALDRTAALRPLP
jgi:arginase family enzyme